VKFSPLALRVQTYKGYATLELFTAMKIQVAVFSIVTPCSFVIGYKRFGGPCYLHLQSIWTWSCCNQYHFSSKILLWILSRWWSLSWYI